MESLCVAFDRPHPAWLTRTANTNRAPRGAAVAGILFSVLRGLDLVLAITKVLVSAISAPSSARRSACDGI